MTGSIKPTSRIDSIQLLRGVAALAVVTQHVPLLANGAWGVDVFFVISGFIVCYVTQKSADHFWTKRVIRVAPLYWLGTLSVFACALLFPKLLNNTTASLADLAKSLTFIPFLKGTVVQPVLFPGWTLNYEMFFYLTFAISMAISHAHRWIICSLALAALVAAGALVPFESVAAKFYTASIMLEFIFGMVCFQIYERFIKDVTLSSGTVLVLLLGSVAALVSMPFMTPFTERLGRAVAWGVPATVLFLATLSGLQSRMLPKAVLLIGDASFSLYLFHPYLIQAFEKVFHAFLSRTAAAYFMALFAIAACCVASIVIYQFVERPLTNYLRSLFIQDRVAMPIASPAS